MKIVLWIVSIILGLALLYFLIPGFFALFVNPKKSYTKDSKHYRTILNAASVIALKIMRVKIQVSGAEKLPHGQKLCSWVITVPILIRSSRGMHFVIGRSLIFQNRETSRSRFLDVLSGGVAS